MASERKFVVENIRRVLLKEYLMKETQRAGFGGLDIQRTPMGTRISLFIERPGIVIGRQGGAIKSLTETLEKEFKFDNPQIEVQEVDNPSLNAQIMAEKLAVALERGWHFRRAGHSTVRRIMDAGARGCQVVISGKLTGQRHRTEKFKEGHIKHCGDPKNKFMKIGFAVATLKLGIIGVKVQIMDQKSRLPDDIEVARAVAAPEAAPVRVQVKAEVSGGEDAQVKDEAVGEAAAEVTPGAEVEAEPGAAVEARPEKAAEPAAAKPAEKEKPVLAVTKPEKKPQVGPAEKPEEKPVAKPEVRPEAEPEQRPEAKPKVMPEKEPEPLIKPEEAKAKKPVKKAADLKTKKLRKVAKKLEDLGEDVDVDLRVDGEEK